ncbi:MAG: hypothetical protein EBR71_00745, partial [Planctomycetes bacterium]|nr:hypothetical protein [Planctomycetota bacterium]
MGNVIRKLVGNGPLRGGIRKARMWWVRTRHGLRHVHPTAYISTLAGVEIARDVRIAEHVYVGNGCVIGKNVSIGRYTMLAPRVSIVGADHRIDVPGTPMIFAGRPEQKATGDLADDRWDAEPACRMPQHERNERADDADRERLAADPAEFADADVEPDGDDEEEHADSRDRR